MEIAESSKLTVVVSGSSGLLGAALCSHLRSAGHLVSRIVRQRDEAGPHDVFWDQIAGRLDAAKLRSVDAVVHLAGENLFDSRWNKRKKQRIYDSRVKSAALLASTIATLKSPPAVFLCASAIGYYGDRGEEVLTEQSSQGEGFFPDLVRDWEAATAPARVAGIRVVNARFAPVLARHDGALKQMLLPFKLGLGAVLGDGQQYMSWVSLHDAVRALDFLLQGSVLAGPVNVCAPQPVRNVEFTHTLARELRRPALLRAPRWVLKLLLGEMGEAVLQSERVFPTLLVDAGFTFKYPQLSDALHHALEAD